MTVAWCSRGGGVQEGEQAGVDVVAVVEAGTVTDSREDLGPAVRHQADSCLGAVRVQQWRALADQNQGGGMDSPQFVVLERPRGRSARAECAGAGEQDLPQFWDEQDGVVQADGEPAP
jgi:hypothetical protein